MLDKCDYAICCHRNYHHHHPQHHHHDHLHHTNTNHSPSCYDPPRNRTVMDDGRVMHT